MTFDRYSRNMAATLFGALLLLSCTKDKTAPKIVKDCNVNSHSFSNDVQPILQTNCALSDCHTSAQDEGMFPLNTYEDVILVATDPKFLPAINHGPGALPMPSNESKLPLEQIYTIECWVEAGMPND